MDAPPEEGSDLQHQRDAGAHVKWTKKDRCARFVLLSNMHNDLISAFENYKTARKMYNVLKLKFGETSAMRLRMLTLKFDSHKMIPNENMKQHLKKMSSVIHKIKAAENNLSDK